MNSQYIRHEVRGCETSNLRNFWEKTIEQQTRYLQVERERQQRSALTKLVVCILKGWVCTVILSKRKVMPILCHTVKVGSNVYFLIFLENNKVSQIGLLILISISYRFTGWENNLLIQKLGPKCGNSWSY